MGSEQDKGHKISMFTIMTLLKGSPQPAALHPAGARSVKPVPVYQLDVNHNNY